MVRPSRLFQYEKAWFIQFRVPGTPRISGQWADFISIKVDGQKDARYWSGSSYANNSDNAWNVNFNNGNVNANNKTNNNYVRCVRSGA